MRGERTQRLIETVGIFIALWLVAMPVALLARHSPIIIAITIIAALATITAAVARG